MVITIAKHPGKPPTLSCLRSDGSVTWQNYRNQGNFFPAHDLAHYAIETIMGYRQAFFGAVATGRELNAFGPGDAASFPPEMLWAEMLAGLLTASEGAGSTLTFEEIVQTVNAQMAERNMPPPAIRAEQLAAIRKKAADLIAFWQTLPEDGQIRLEFA